MKSETISLLSVMILFSSLLAFSGCRSKQARNHESVTGSYHTCPMHHQIHEDKPGDCPICGMKLIRITPADNKNGPVTSGDSVLSYLTQPVTRTVIGSFKVIEPVNTSIRDTITAAGYIGFDQRDVNAVSTRVTGRVEKLYVHYSGQSIRKGQILLYIYSPELLSAERNLLQAVQDNDQTLTAGLKAQLLNLGMTPFEIQKIMERNAPLAQVPVYSPYNGIVLLANTTTKQSTPQPLDIREGMYVNRGQTVFTIQNTNRIWAILDVFTQDISHIHPGDLVNLSADADPGSIINGHVDFISPYRAAEERTSRIRIYLNHVPPTWKIGTLIHGHIAITNNHQGWTVPLSAVNRLGMRSIVWVLDKEQGEVFHAREVKTGIRTNDSIQIIAGIHGSDKIAENASYMVDSDSFLE